MSNYEIKDLMQVINQKLKDNNLHDKPIKTQKDIDKILDVLFDDIDEKKIKNKIENQKKSITFKNFLFKQNNNK